MINHHIYSIAYRNLQTPPTVDLLTIALKAPTLSSQEAQYPQQDLYNSRQTTLWFNEFYLLNS